MANNKVVFGNQTIIDLTNATATADDLDAGATAYNRSGELITGTAKNVKWTEQNVLGAKNMLPNTAQNRTANGLTFTVLSDGSIKAVGTATADTTLEINSGFSIPAGEYRLWKGERSAGVYMTCMRADNTRFEIASGYQNSDATFTEPQTFTRTYFWVNNGTVLDTVFYPMLSVKSVLVTDTTYEPYAMTNAWLTNAMLGEQRNLFRSAMTGKTVENNGATFVGRDDGGVSVTCSASDAFRGVNTWLAVAGSGDFAAQALVADLEDGVEYELSGVGQSNTGVYAYVNLLDQNGALVSSLSARSNTTLRLVRRIGNTVIVKRSPAAEDEYAEGVKKLVYGIGVAAGTAANNVVVYPMLKASAFQNKVFTPYAMNNQQLTAKIAELEARIAALEA